MDWSVSATFACNPGLSIVRVFGKAFPPAFIHFETAVVFRIQSPLKLSAFKCHIKEIIRRRPLKNWHSLSLLFFSQILNCYWIYPSQLLPRPSAFAIIPSVWEAKSRNIPLCPLLYLFHVCALPAGYEYKFRATCFLSLMTEPEVISISLCENNCRKHLYDLVHRVCLALDLSFPSHGFMRCHPWLPQF